MKKMLLLALSAMIYVAAHAQTQQSEMPPNAIYGQILDSLTQKALPEVNVVIITSVDPATKLTDEKGAFCVYYRNYPESGEVIISKKGYQTKRIAIPKGSGNGNLGNILLIQGADKPKKKK